MAVALTAAVTGCKTFLDINTNPNQPTSVTPDAILATALATTAANYTGANPSTGVSYNSYASFAADYWAKSGTVSGFSEERTYNYSSTYYQGLWRGTYSNLNNYNLIQQSGTANGYPNHAAIARIMKVYSFLLLVDEYGDIPYTNALQAAGNTTPSYDKASNIYKDFIVQLKGAVADINAAAAVTGARTVGSEDIVFQGDMTKWKQFTNSLLLRILLRESQTTDATINASVAAEMMTLQSAADGFIKTDVVVQPGYAANANQQNPFYDRYGFSVGLTAPTTEYSFVMPTGYIIRQDTLNADPRISQLYNTGKSPGYGATTYVGANAGEGTSPIFVPANPIVGSRFLQGGTFLRGPSAPTVLMLLSEHLLSKAEAETRNLMAGGQAAAKTDYLNGIEASFLFTYRDAVTAPGTIADATTATPGVVQYNTYVAANTTNPLVNYDLAATNGSLGKQSVILYQKYLAENTVASTEAWNDYRRAAQPKIEISLQAGSNPFPKRLFYPQTEVNTNLSNIPSGTTQFTKIFWDVVD